MFYLYDYEGNFIDEFKELGKAESAAIDNAEDTFGERERVTKHEEWTEKGEKTNYEELLLTLPADYRYKPKDQDANKQIMALFGRLEKKYGKARGFNDLWPSMDILEKVEFTILKTMLEASNSIVTGTFVGDHYDNENIVSHIRKSERYDYSTADFSRDDEIRLAELEYMWAVVQGEDQAYYENQLKALGGKIPEIPALNEAADLHDYAVEMFEKYKTEDIARLSQAVGRLKLYEYWAPNDKLPSNILDRMTIDEQMQYRNLEKYIDDALKRAGWYRLEIEYQQGVLKEKRKGTPIYFIEEIQSDWHLAGKRHGWSDGTFKVTDERKRILAEKITFLETMISTTAETLMRESEIYFDENGFPRSLQTQYEVALWKLKAQAFKLDQAYSTLSMPVFSPSGTKEFTNVFALRAEESEVQRRLDQVADYDKVAAAHSKKTDQLFKAREEEGSKFQMSEEKGILLNPVLLSSGRTLKTYNELKDYLGNMSYVKSFKDDPDTSEQAVMIYARAVIANEKRVKTSLTKFKDKMGNQLPIVKARRWINDLRQDLFDDFVKYKEAKDSIISYGGGKIPYAPFVEKTAPLLSFKRALRDAVDRGYTKIGWTTGVQQARRYRMARHIQRIDFKKIDDNTTGLRIVDIDGNQQQSSIAANTQTRYGWGKSNGSNNYAFFPNEYVADLVSDELAEKILGKEGGSLEGLDLEMGGYGKKQFYDKHLVNVANAYLKKWGVKVKSGEIEVEHREQEYLGPIPSYDELQEFMIEYRDSRMTAGTKWYGEPSSYSDQLERVWYEVNQKTMDAQYPSTEEEAVSVLGGSYFGKADFYEGWMFIEAMEKHGSQSIARDYFEGTIKLHRGKEKIHTVDITDQMRQSIEAGQPLFKGVEPDPMGAFPDHVRGNIEAARGFKPPGLKERIQAAIEKTAHSFSRHFLHLDPKTDGAIINTLRVFQEIPNFTKKKAMDHIASFLEGLSTPEYDTFNMTLLMRDMYRDMTNENPLTGKPILDPADGLPFGFDSEQQVKDTLDKFEAMVEGNPKIKAAIKNRYDFMRKLRGDLVERKMLNKNVLENEDYFHHQVLEHLAKKFGLGVSSKDVRIHKKGWQISRQGSIKDYNTEYLESEFEVISQGLAQVEAKNTMDTIEDQVDISRELKDSAKARNIKSMMENLEAAGLLEKKVIKVPGPGGKKIDRVTDEWEDPLKPFKTKIGMANSNLAKMAAKGQLYGPAEYDDLIENLADSWEQYQASKKDYPDDPDMWDTPGVDDNRWFQFLSYLVNSKSEGATWAATVFNAIRERNDFIKAAAGKKFVTWQQILPKGYTLWKPKPFSAWYLTNSLSDKILEQVLEGSRQLEEGDARKILARGLDVQWAIPENVGLTLDDFRAFQKTTFVGEMGETILNRWKQWILINPFRIFKYNFNNMSGDSDITLAYDPRIIKNYSYQATKDMWKFHYKKDLSGKAYITRKSGPVTRQQDWGFRTQQEELDYAFRHGVIGSGMTVHDIPDIVKNMEYDKFISTITGKKPNIIQQFWKESKNFTTYRENVLRLAAFRYFSDRLKAGEKNIYGASNPDIVDKIADPLEKAALLSRELIGDYGNISEAGQYIRRRLIPFYSWMEINAPRYVRMWRNLPVEGKGTKDALRIGSIPFAKAGAGLAFKMTMLYTMVNMWNMIFFPDEEKELGEFGRRQMHIILPPGRREDGTITTLRFQGALSDALEWFGFEDFPQDMMDLATRKMSFYDLLRDAGKGFANKWIRGFRPDIKMVGEVLTRKGFYPDAFRPRPIRDRIEHLLRTISFDMPYRRLRGRPLRGEDPIGRMLYDVSSIFTYSADPGEVAYYDTRRLASEYLDDKGVERPSVEPTSKSNALYWYKQALKYSDFKAAEKYITEYKERGGTLKGLKISIRLAHPMSGLPVKYRRAFFGSISPEDQEKVKSAIRWYEQTYLTRKGEQ